jgi:hypothetical protein
MPRAAIPSGTPIRNPGFPRTKFSQLDDGFSLAGQGGKIPVVNPGGTALIPVAIGVVDDHMVLADAGDPAAGYLDSKTDNSTLDITAGHKIEVKALGITDTQVAAANKDGLAATPSMRTLGNSAQSACSGSDTRLSDPRTPTAHAIGGVAHSADTIADIQSKVSDGSLITTNPGEIAALTVKGTPANTDLLVIEDSGDSNNKKQITIGSIQLAGLSFIRFVPIVAAPPHVAGCTEAFILVADPATIQLQKDSGITAIAENIYP